MFRGHVVHLLLAVMILLPALPLVAQEEGCETPLALAPGVRINTRPGIFVRNLPTISGGIAEYLGESTTFRVQAGPVCADGINWWPVRGPINFNPGFVAEREFFGGRFLIFVADPDPETLCVEPLNLVSGSKLPLLNDVRIRQEPNLNGFVLHVALQGETVTVVEGPRCIDELNWWLVQLPFADIILQGWMAEGRFGATFVRDPDQPGPDQICSPSLPLGSGDRAAVNVSDYRPKNLRSEPGANAPILFKLIEGIAFDVVSGPVCADNLNWWQIQIVTRPDVVGWLSEGGPGNYAIRRFTQDRLVGN